MRGGREPEEDPAMNARQADDATPAPRAPRTLAATLVENGLVRWHIVAALTWLAIALLAGFFYSMQLLQSWPLPKIAVLSPGRIGTSSQA